MDLSGAVLEHANRGVRLQLLLRAALVVFLLLTIILIPPVQGVAAYYGIVGAYAVGAAAFARWAWRGGFAVARWGWLGLFADLVVLAAVTLVAGVDAQRELDLQRPRRRLLPPARAGRHAAAARRLRRRGRADRRRLPHRQPRHPGRQRRALGVDRPAHVHARQRGRRVRRPVVDPAVAGARDRPVAGGPHPPARRARAPGGSRAPRPLRAPARRCAAIRAGSATGPRRSARAAPRRRSTASTTPSPSRRGCFARRSPSCILPCWSTPGWRGRCATSPSPPPVATSRSSVDVDDWPDGRGRRSTRLLLSAARELLSNVVKHADARHARVSLGLRGDWARLVVADDGRGVSEQARQQRLDDGHIGLHSQTLRVEAAGGTLTVVGEASGTVATVVVPVEPLPSRGS